ncbi:MAG: hypothetical protein ACF8AM_22085 [Rhodopirellula sp. JB055]|uniref:hypothetical protein n=1 Tax=Rhodopirellula sp. JB055 TaxID=3342846 RepID=UPI00370C1E68
MNVWNDRGIQAICGPSEQHEASFGTFPIKHSVATIPEFVWIERIAAVLYRLNDVVASGKTLNQLLVVGVQ